MRSSLVLLQRCENLGTLADIARAIQIPPRESEVLQSPKIMCSSTVNLHAGRLHVLLAQLAMLVNKNTWQPLLPSAAF